MPTLASGVGRSRVGRCHVTPCISRCEGWPANTGAHIDLWAPEPAAEVEGKWKEKRGEEKVWVVV